MIELTVTIKGEESSFKQKFLLYDKFQCHQDDPIITNCVETALSNAKIEPIDIKVRALMQYRWEQNG